MCVLLAFNISDFKLAFRQYIIQKFIFFVSQSSLVVTKWSVLCVEIIAVYSEGRTKQTQFAGLMQFSVVKAGDIAGLISQSLQL
jgi:hypothetical protein